MELTNLLANPGLKLGGLLGATLGLSYAANYWLSRLFSARVYRVLVAPGIIVHEYSHALGCLLTGTAVHQVRVFDRRGGEVIHTVPRFPLAQGIISTAPVVGAAIAVYLLALVLLPGLVDSGELQLSAWQIFVFGLLSASITTVMAPSWADLKAGLISYALLCGLLGLGALNERLADYFTRLFGGAFDGLVAVVSFALLILLAVTVAAGVGFGLARRQAEPRYRAQ